MLVLERKEQSWKIVSDHFNGITVNMVFENKFSGEWWVALDHGLWGNKLRRSADKGTTWQEIEAPKYPDGSLIKDEVPAILKYIWAFSTVAPEKKDELWIGTEPGGLFKLDSKKNSTLVEIYGIILADQSSGLAVGVIMLQSTPLLLTPETRIIFLLVSVSLAYSNHRMQARPGNHVTKVFGQIIYPTRWSM